MSWLAYDRAFDAALADSARATAPAVRRAAWLLHGLPTVDRTWLLEQLDDAQRGAVAPALRELGEWGAAAPAGPAGPDASQPNAVVAAPPVEKSAVEPPVLPAEGSLPAAQTPAWPSLWRLSLALRAEPDAVAVAVLQAQARHRQRLLLWSLPSARRRALRTVLKGRATPLAAGLEVALRRALAGHGPERPAR